MEIDPLVVRAIESYGAVPVAAKKLGVSESLLYQVLRGARNPGKKLLKALGLSRVTVNLTEAK
jgi:hypothetical protein